MRTALRNTASAVFLAVVLTGCGQSVESPCVGSENTEMCPGCDTDADCAILTNRCHESAICIPAAANWAVAADGCPSFLERIPPPSSACGCVEGVCRAR